MRAIIPVWRGNAGRTGRIVITLGRPLPLPKIPPKCDFARRRTHVDCY